jgi:hypothetical protein
MMLGCISLPEVDSKKKRQGHLLTLPFNLVTEKILESLRDDKELF